MVGRVPGGLLGNIVPRVVHGHVEAIASDNLVDVGRLGSSWEYQWIQTFNNEL